MKKKIIGFYPMVADILHTGHIVALKEAKDHCDYLIVGLHCCPNYKKPLQTIFERYMQLKACKYVDEVIPYTDINDARTMILALNYDIYFCGEDHKGVDFENKQVLEDLNKNIYYLSRKHNLSSTDLKNRIKEEY